MYWYVLTPIRFHGPSKSIPIRAHDLQNVFIFIDFCCRIAAYAFVVFHEWIGTILQQHQSALRRTHHYRVMQGSLAKIVPEGHVGIASE